MGLERLCKVPEPEGDSCNVEHCEIVLGALFILSGDSAEPLEAAEQALHAIASSIRLSVKAATAVLIGFGGDHRADLALFSYSGDADQAF